MVNINSLIFSFTLSDDINVVPFNLTVALTFNVAVEIGDVVVYNSILVCQQLPLILTLPINVRTIVTPAWNGIISSV